MHRGGTVADGTVAAHAKGVWKKWNKQSNVFIVETSGRICRRGEGKARAVRNDEKKVDTFPALRYVVRRIAGVIQW